MNTICCVGVKTLVLMLALTKYGYQVDASVSIQHLSTSSSSAEPSIIRNNRHRHLFSRKTTAVAEEDGGTDKKLVCGDQFRPILPSVTTQQPAPTITLATNGKVFSSDAPHLVSHVDRINNDGILRVVLPGTTDSPSSKSCLLDSIASYSRHMIGLSYAFLNSPDGYRSNACREEGKVSSDIFNSSRINECLAMQHDDALWGGNSFPTIWQNIQWEDSIVGRLTYLLVHLSNEYPGEGWDLFLSPPNDEATSDMRPNWERVWIIGYSQGSGHAGYLAQTYTLAGAGLLSGPQDEDYTCAQAQELQEELIISPLFWIEMPFATQNIRAMAHMQEASSEQIQENWSRMPFQNSEDYYIIGNEQDVMKARLPNNTPWLTTIPPQPNATCAAFNRAFHCSTAANGNSPIVEVEGDTNPYLYASSVWPQLAGFTPSTATDKEKASDNTSSSVARDSVWTSVVVVLSLIFVF